MSLHRLSHVVIGVPNVADTCAYYTDFGLRPGVDGSFSTSDGGRQLRVVPAPRRRLMEVASLLTSWTTSPGSPPSYGGSARPPTSPATRWSPGNPSPGSWSG